MAAEPQIVVFGDLSVPYHAELRRRLSEKRNYVLEQLFSQSYYALKSEISQLPPSQRAVFPSSSNLDELLTAQQVATTANFALDCALFSLSQLSSFISYAIQSKAPYPAPHSSCLAGRCMGLLAAVAVSCSEDVYDLVSLSPEIVVLAFRLGNLVESRTKSVSLSSGKGASYSSVLAGIDQVAASQLLNAFFEQKGVPLHGRAYISAVGRSNITISGPPMQVKGFLSQHNELKTAKIQVDGLFHSSALYIPGDVKDLLTSCTSVLRGRTARLPVVPNGSESLRPESRTSTCAELLDNVISDILLHQMRWDLATDEIVRFAKKTSCSRVKLLKFVAGSVEDLSSALRGNVLEVAQISLAAGRDVHKDIPKDRFDPQLYFDPTGKKKNTSGVTKGCFVRNPDLFDARFFSMSPREAEQADPAQRLALMTAYEAMEMAGFVPDSTPSTQRSRVGVFYGTASDDYREINAAQNVDTYFVPGGSRAFLPARINYHFRFSGPSFDVDTACSSGLAAVHIACNSLWAGDCDVSIAGGTNILTNPDNWAGLDRAHFLSRTGNCNTFDDAADGYCRADTVATVLLKRLEDALLDDDPIYGIITGAYTNHSAEAVSMTRPHSGAQRAICTRVLSSANADTSEVSYIEMHGTGTQHGDACEMDSVLSVFAPDISSRKTPLYIGSVKANVGHSESAAGISSLIKVLLMMQNDAIPRHVGIKTVINKNFPKDLEQRNVHIALENKPWPRPDPKAAPQGRKVFINNFGAAGGNSSILVEDGPVRAPSETTLSTWPVHIVAVSAKSQKSLKGNIQALAEYLEHHPDVSLEAVSFTTTARRTHYAYRTAVMGTTTHEVRNSLQAMATQEKYLSTVSGGPPVGFCFTGQGSQYLGMGKKLLDLPRFASLLLGLDEIVRLQGFPSIYDVVSGKTKTLMEDLSPVQVQLGITCLQMALGKFWISLGVSPQVVVGHSLGEYAALNISGMLTDTDTIHLVGTRARLLERFCSMGTHSMLAVKASASETSSLRSPSHLDLDIACVNGPDETVVAGPTAQIKAFKHDLEGRSIKFTELKVQFAFHSAQVEPILETFRQTCGVIVMHEPKFPVMSPLLGKAISSVADIGPVGHYLARHCRETVNFHQGLVSARDSGAVPKDTIWVEVGPHPICSNMVRSALGPSTQTVPSLRRGEDDSKVFTPAVAKLYNSGIAINWAEYHSGWGHNKHVILLPSYQWELKSHWIPYRHDWCLTKGDAPALQQNSAQPLVEATTEKRVFTTSVQHITAESYGATESSIAALTDVQHPDFREALLGHRVNGRPICSSSVYADMAITLFSRLLEKSPVSFDKSDIGIEVRDMAADKSLILNDGSSPQLVEMEASVNWSTRQASFIMFSASTKNSISAASHAKCCGLFSEKSRWKSEWRRRDFLIKPRIEDLRKAVNDDSGAVHMIKTGMFYKLFSSLVDYYAPFKGCRELVMRSADLESTAKVRFNTPPETGEKWQLPPYWVDSLGQITGFTMNANDEVDSKNLVYINHGWDNMRIAGTLTADVTYNTYVKMQPKDAKSYCGDVYIFGPDMGEIVAIYEGVTFSAVPRKVLDMVLPKSASEAAHTAAPQRAVISEDQAPVLNDKKTQDIPILVQSQKKASTADELKRIVAEEVGAAITDVQDDSELAPLGVDSLLALTISDRMLQELGMRVDSSTFITSATVAELIQTIIGSPTPSSESGPATPLSSTRQTSILGNFDLPEKTNDALTLVQVESDHSSDTLQSDDEQTQT